jgi:nitroreductase
VIGENAYLATTSAGPGACGVGAFTDDAINDMLGVDATNQAVVYMLAIRHPR